MAIAVRRLEVNDAGAAIELLQRFKPSVGFDLPAMQGFLSKSGNVLLECALDGEPAGFALGYILDRVDGGSPMLFLYEIEVLESHRRRGLARTMIEELKAGADGKFFVLTQRSNPAAIGLYSAARGRQVHPDDVLFSFDRDIRPLRARLVSRRRSQEACMTRLAVGTEKGAYVLDGSGDTWDVSGPTFPGWKVTAFGKSSAGTHLAAVGSNWFGVGVHRSSDFDTWEQIDSPPSWPEDSERKMEQIWTFHDAGQALWAGVAHAGLFRSTNDGLNWDPVKGLNEHRTRSDWEPGLGGLCAHRIRVDDQSGRAWVAISAVGTFRSDDGGETWEPKNDGISTVGAPEDAERPEVGYCVHSIAHDESDPGRIWRQDHSGVYRTEDGGDNWERIETGLPANFGFVMWRDASSERLFTIPLEADTNRVPREGDLRVYRSDNDGDSWEQSGSGWSDDPQFTGVLRGAYDGDHSGLFAFGTTGGKVWVTEDNGESWNQLPSAFPRIGALKVIG